MFILSSKYEKIIKLLNLDKPVILLDIETTGRAISEDKIVELAYIKIWPDGRTKKDDIFFYPEIKISPEATAIHGIKNCDLKNKPKFKDKAQELWEILNNCYYGGFNIVNFDLPIIRREFVRVGMDFEYSKEHIIDAKEIYHYLEPSSISSAYGYYCKKNLTQERSPKIYVEAAAEILISQLIKYRGLLDREFINKIHGSVENGNSERTAKFYWLHGKPYFNFSKYKNQALSEIAKKDRKFLEWILSADFDEDVKSIVKVALEDKENKK